MFALLTTLALASTPCDRSALVSASDTSLMEAAAACEGLAASGPAGQRVSALVTLGAILEHIAQNALREPAPAGVEGEQLTAYYAVIDRDFVKPALRRAAERYDRALALASKEKVENHDTSFARARLASLPSGK